ncbi:MAG: cysteine peptidase family C39 domain-containing protein, partial [Flavobacteriales bacterium]|nr:cysteine peptidase family C39 domain-containing protein [Flavobacteriales bacterium]
MKKAFKSFTLQHDQSDCGVACLLSVVKFYSGSNTLENLRDLSGTDTQGTTLLGLYQAANKIGFNASGCEADVTSLINHKRPVILHVIIDGKLNHYVVFYGYKNQKFIIGDPAKGIVYYTKEELLEVWKERKCLTLKVNSNFKQVKEVSRAKKIFLINLIKEDYPLLVVSLLFGILISILGMVMAVFSQQLIDHILPSKNSTILITSIVLVTFLLLVRIAFEALRQQILLRQSKDFNNRIIHSFYKTLLYLSKSFFDSRKIGELVARLNDTGRIQRV